MYLESIYSSKINKILHEDIMSFEQTINLIGSANIPFREVTQSLSYPIFSNPLEGFRNNRIYPNSKSLDEIENLGEEYLKNLLNYCEKDYSANFQPHSGTTANQIVYNAILDKDDIVLSMSINSGGHISHHDYIKHFFTLMTYDVNQNEEIDYIGIERIVQRNNIKLLIAGASSFPNEINYPLLSQICKKYNVLLMADISHTVLFISEGIHSSPINNADFITFTTHKTTRGSRGGIIIYKNEFSTLIENSIFPVTQSAPKFYDILSKVTMLDKLSDYDRKEYILFALNLSQYFVKYFQEKSIKVFTNKTDTHLVVLDFSNQGFNAINAEDSLAEINILSNRCYLPKDENEPNGLRFGFLSLAVVRIDISDFKQICDCIYEHLFITNNVKLQNRTSTIAEKYFKGYYNDK